LRAVNRLGQRMQIYLCPPFLFISVLTAAAM